MAETPAETSEWKSDVQRVATILERSSQENLEKYYPEFLEQSKEDGDNDGDESTDADGSGGYSGEVAQDAAADSPDADGNSEPEGTAGEQPETEGEPDEEPEGDQPADGELDEAIDLKALAKKVGVEVSELYGVEVAMGQGREPLTLGELKDMANDLHTIEDRRESVIQQEIEHQNAVLRDQQEISYIVDVLGEVPDQLRQLAAEKHQMEATKQREKLLTIFPEWQEPQQYVAARQRMVQTLDGYGLSETDLSMILDARWIKVVHDLGVMKEHFSKAEGHKKRLRKLPKKPAQKAKRKAPSKAGQREKLIADAKASTDPNDKYAAVATILNQKTGGR